MNFNKTVLDVLFARQINPYQKFYQNQIVCSFLKSNELFESQISTNLAFVSCIQFCDNEKYLIQMADNIFLTIWEINNDNNFVLKLKKQNLGLANNFRINKDFSKIFCYDCFLFHVYDLMNFELISKKEFWYIFNVLCHPENLNAATICGSGFCGFNLYSFDCRIGKYEVINENFCGFKCFQYHPTKEYLLLMAPEEQGLFQFDMRNHKPIVKYNATIEMDSLHLVNAQFSTSGDKFFLLNHKLNPVIYDVKQPDPIIEFKQEGLIYEYCSRNCCFGGPNDEYFFSMANNGSFHMWEIPEDSEIDKCDSIKIISNSKLLCDYKVRNTGNACYNYEKSVLASCAGSKIKLWSIFPFKKEEYLCEIK